MHPITASHDAAAVHCTGAVHAHCTTAPPYVAALVMLTILAVMVLPMAVVRIREVRAERRS